MNFELVDAIEALRRLFLLRYVHIFFIIFIDVF